MKRLRNILVIALIFVFSYGYAWGPKGHNYVAEIAKKYLNKGVEDSAQKYLVNTTFEEASVWMDEIKKDHTYDYMKSWHYINIDKDKTYVKTREPNVVNELETSIFQLNNRKALSKQETETNLKIIFHLIGDLHMPLHDGYGEDRGGNDIKVDYFGKQKKLHYIWDVAMLENKKITIDDCLKVGSEFSNNQIKELQKIDIVKWMQESRFYLPQVYDIKNNSIDEDYVNKSISIIEKQIFIAGIRLAAVLNETFKK